MLSIENLKLLTQTHNNLKIKILSAKEDDIELYLDKLGIKNRELTLQRGPWSCYILKDHEYEVAISSQVLEKLEIDLVN